MSARPPWTEAELEHLLSSPLALFLSVDRDLRLRRVSSSAARAGERMPPEWYTGRALFELFPSPEAEGVFRRVLETGERTLARGLAVEHPRRRWIGTTYWDFSLRPTFGTDGTIDGLTCVLTDATLSTRARLELEQQARLLDAKLKVMEHALSPGHPPDLASMLEPLAQVLGADTASILTVDAFPDGPRLVAKLRWLRSPDLPVIAPQEGLPVAAVQGWFDRLVSQQALLAEFTPDGPAPAAQLHARGHRTFLAAALIGSKGIPGALYFSSIGRSRPWGDAELGAVRSYAALLAGLFARDAAVEGMRAQERRATELAFRLETAVEEERRRVGRELHDGLGQQLGSVKLGLEALAGSLPAAERARALELAAGLQSAMGETRRLARNLHPVVIDDLGLAAALEGLVDELQHARPGLHAIADVAPGADDLAERLRVPAYRITQESLQNVLRHAAATHVRVGLHRGGDGWLLEITDDGSGFDPTQPAQGLGLRSIAERASLSGGAAEWTSNPGEGTTVRVTWPFSAATSVPPEMGD